MKLYLSSYRLGDHPDELIKLMGNKKRTVVIANACDPDDYVERRGRNVQREFDDLATIGINAEELDLRNFFGKPNELTEELKRFDLIWVRGGNVFVLAKAFKQSGADVIIKELIEDDEIVYGGYSAGACILAPNLHGIELVDDAKAKAENYSDYTEWQGMGILPFSIAPHYLSDHPESEAIIDSVNYFIENHMPFVALKDGQAIIVQNGNTRFL